MKFYKKVYHNLLNRKKTREAPCVSIGEGCCVSRSSKFAGYNRIGDNTIFHGELGRGSYIGNNGQISAKIGAFCSVGSNVYVINGIHPLDRNLCTSPSFYSRKASEVNGLSLYIDKKIAENPKSDSGYSITIGNNVWIGYGAILMPGIDIADGAVIASGAVVTRNVGPYEVVGGVPAKLIKKRFPQSIVEELLKIDIWNLPIEELKAYAPFMNDVEDFLREWREKHENSDYTNRV